MSHKMHRRIWSRRIRNAGGNMIALMVACAVGFVVLLLFALSYVRMLGSHGEQKTAIESAALAAAKDASKIVYNDPNFGFIGFSDSAPVGQSTKAGDNFYMPVSSINSLMGTARLDLTIANEINNPEMQALAKRDLNNLKTAKDNLIGVINEALSGPGKTATDADGKPVSLYEDAVAAYKSNNIRMSGNSSYVDGSLKLTLGSIPNGETNIPIPKPVTYAHCDDSQQKNGNYVGSVNVPTSDGTQFVFADLGTSVRLVDDRAFKTSIDGLAFQMPSVIRAEADQTYNVNGTASKQHISASAQGSNLFDPHPAPGAFSIAFPDGIPPEVSKPGDLLKAPFTTSTPVVGQTPPNGDYPADPGSTLTPVAPGGWDGLSGPPTAGGAVGIGLYDWLRRGGSKVNIDSVKKALTINFADSGSASANTLTTNYYTFDAASGDVVYTSRKLSDPNVGPPNKGSYNPSGPDPISVVSENQLLTTSQNVLKSSDEYKYDLYVRDESHKPGTIKGGQHGGEPLDESLLNETLTHIDTGNVKIACDQLEPVKIASNKIGSGSTFDCGGQGDGAHWGISVGTGPNPPLAQIDITSCGHVTSVSIYADALLSRNDWNRGLGPFHKFKKGPSPGTSRPTYLQNGLVSEVRMRRVIDLTGTGLVGGAYGNFGKRKYPPGPPYGLASIFLRIP